MSVVVSDTGPLHYLILSEAIEILPQLFQQVIVPPTVFTELQHPNAPQVVRQWVASNPGWLRMQAPGRLDLSLKVDRGELEAICLAREVKADLVLMDDLKGRAAAVQCGLVVSGTIGVMEIAAAQGMIDLASAFTKLQATNARIDSAIMKAALERVQKHKK